jgi:hypothetical protein
MLHAIVEVVLFTNEDLRIYSGPDYPLPSELRANGFSFGFFDAPGVNGTFATVSSASLDFSFVLDVSFISGGQTAQCAQIDWSAYVNWPLFGQPTGGVTVGGN